MLVFDMTASMKLNLDQRVEYNKLSCEEKELFQTLFFEDRLFHGPEGDDTYANIVKLLKVRRKEQEDKVREIFDMICILEDERGMK